MEKDDFCACWNAHVRHDIGVRICRKGRGLMSCNIFDMRMALVCQEHDCCSWIEVGDNFWELLVRATFECCGFGDLAAEISSDSIISGGKHVNISGQSFCANHVRW